MKQFAQTLFKLTGLTLALNCAGCVDIGLFSKEPYPPEVLQKLSQKNVDRSLVSKTLGRPVATRAKGTYWFYASDRERWWLIGSDVVMRDSEWVGIQFDDSGHVSFIDHNDDMHGCLSNGICHFYGLFSKQPSKLVITAPMSEDAAAKSHQARADECAVYLYHEPLPWFGGLAPAAFSVDGKTRGFINDKTYLFLTHAIGEISISAYQFTMTTKCEEGNRLYIRATKAMDWSWDTGEDLSPVDAAEGESAIRSRRLALPN